MLSFALILLEGLVGGVQVRLGLTADSTDPARGLVQGIHLANTFALLGALLLGIIRNAFVLLHLSPFFQTMSTGIVIVLAALLDQIRLRQRAR